MVIVVVESDVLVRCRVGQWLRDRCGTTGSVVEAATEHEARTVAARLRADGRPPAMVVVGARLADGSQRDHTGWAATFPEATRVLLGDAGAAGAGRDASRDVGWAAHLAGDDLSELAPWVDAALTGALNGVMDGAPVGVSASAPAAGKVHVIGRRYGPLAHEIKDFLARNFVPFRWHDVDLSARAAALAASVGLAEPVPTTVLLGERTVLREPSLSELAAALGLAEPLRDERCDLVIVGGGPAGLAAAVYGACEGLRVVVVETNAPGGQAGSTSRIENYLGFPAGLSGTDLAQRALVQARRFGARWLVGHRATGLEPDPDGHVVHIDDGSTVRSRAVLVATGMRWRRLDDIPGAARFVNRGIYYGASLVEAAHTAGEDVYVVGAGNSAGQAALFLAEHARSVTLLVRGESLDTAPISRYLAERIEQTRSITVRTHTVIAEAAGHHRLESLVLRHNGFGTTERVATGSAYVLIGMQPCTDWLPDTVARDTHGFLLTGTAASTHRPAMITETSLPGVFAAGDACAGTVKRVGAAVGQGALAIQVIAEHLRDRTPNPAPARPVRQFDLLDTDSNGYVEENDLLDAAHRLVTRFDEPTGSPRAQRVRSSYTTFWTTLARLADTDGDHRITRTEFDTALHTIADQTPLFTSMAEAVVALCDTDDDGQLNHVEFHKLLSALGVSIDDVNQLFHTLDTDHSGYLDTTEITHALRRFYAGAHLTTATTDHH